MKLKWRQADDGGQQIGQQDGKKEMHNIIELSFTLNGISAYRINAKQTKMSEYVHGKVPVRRFNDSSTLSCMHGHLAHLNSIVLVWHFQSPVQKSIDSLLLFH